MYFTWFNFVWVTVQGHIKQQTLQLLDHLKWINPLSTVQKISIIRAALKTVINTIYSIINAKLLLFTVSDGLYYFQEELFIPIIINKCN